MAGINIDDDNYVANLLAQDARNATKKYEMVGLDAFTKRPRNGAVKPNTGFLRHIIKQTQNHNAALLAKEAEESQARLERLDDTGPKAYSSKRERNSRACGKSNPSLLDPHPEKRKRRDSSGSEDQRRRRAKRLSDDLWRHLRRDDESGKPEKRRHRRRTDEEEASRSKRRVENSSHHRSRRRRDDDEKSEHHQERERRSRQSEKHKQSLKRHIHHRSKSTSPSPSYKASPSTSRQNPHPSRHGSQSPPTPQNRPLRPSPPSPTPSSDPLEAIIGPLPLPSPPLRPRGRGANKASTSTSNINFRFSSTYDPSTDLSPDADAILEDSWGDALEALRDRQRWKQSQGERLRAAGFTDGEVETWERGGRERDGEDVRWGATGQAREWDRDKVVGEDGDVDVVSEYGRLK